MLKISDDVGTCGELALQSCQDFCKAYTGARAIYEDYVAARIERGDIQVSIDELQCMLKLETQSNLGNVEPISVPNQLGAAVLPLPLVAGALKQILAETDVKTANFGQVRRALAFRLGVSEASLEPCREQLVYMTQSILQETDHAASKVAHVICVIHTTNECPCVHQCLII